MSIAIDLNNPTLFFNEEFFQNPYETYHELLKMGDMSFVNLYGGMWYLASYDVITEVITDKRVSHDNLPFLAMQFTQEQQVELSEFFRLNKLWLIHAAEKEHRRYRTLLTKAFSLAMKGIGNEIEKIVNELIDRVIDKRQMDFISEFAYLLPSMVISKMIGIPMKDLDLVVKSADLSSQVFGSTQADFELALQAQRKLVELDEYLKVLIEKRMNNPKDDLISYLLSVDDKGDKLTVEEIAAQCAALLFGGHETTRNLLGNGLLALIQNPDQMEELKQNPQLIKTAVPEMLRYDSPVQFTVRAVVGDMEIQGKTIPAGSPILFCFGSANHDPSKFNNPEKFNIKRNETRNLSFGMGAHSCTGAQLALMEGEIAFNTLLKRVPDIKLVNDKPNWHYNAGFRGLKDLHITF
ncbi:cytochrome P450 [Bacillus wiedmannii]|uniref:cytochrome P450 n=1 Tax=Bacillus wiedmannii TaxID=1890302 RepID=UPI000BF69CFC|nr:cytochrome P450 [Bacillus wiedmannii]PGD97833.1 hypothetical protein COM48_07135 [Bacillus wiedmannii]PHG78282.1 hypothetical protein COI50_11025 [Bacillus wiedmannii]